MRWMPRLLILATVVLAGAGGSGPVWAERLMRMPANEVDPALPDQMFGLWLNNRIPRGAETRTGNEPCGIPPADCLVIEVDIISRARQLVLTFDRKTYTFLSGTLGGPELERMPPITSLAELPGRLTQGIRPYPLDCPDGATLHLEEEYAGLREWCEDAAGVKTGPARAWFSTGRYLMYRGAYLAGERTGPWTECDRFEHCVLKRYLGGRAVSPPKGG